MATRSPNAARNSADHGRRERDLGHHEQHATAVAAYPLGQPQIDFGLAAAGHALEQAT